MLPSGEQLDMLRQRKSQELQDFELKITAREWRYEFYAETNKLLRRRDAHRPHRPQMGQEKIIQMLL